MSSSASNTRRRVAGQRRSGAPAPTRPAATPPATTQPARTQPARTQPATTQQATTQQATTLTDEGGGATPAEVLEPATPPSAPTSPTATVAAPEVAGTHPRRALAVPAAALALALLAVGGLLGLTLRSSGGQDQSTRAATSAAKLSLEQMLSYNYATFDTQSAAAQRLLTGPFRTEFAAAMTTQVKPLAVKNQTVVQARVSEVGVMKQTAGAVTVLAYVNQATVGADAKAPTVDQNRVIATLTKVGERWLVSDVKAF